MRHHSTGSVLDPKEVRLLVEHWYRQKDLPLEPFWKPGPLVPLSRTGEGQAVALGLATLQAENEGSGPYMLSDRALWPTCLNCGEARRGVYLNDGWCDFCAGVKS